MGSAPSSVRKRTGGGEAGKREAEDLTLVARGINLGPPHLWGPEEIHTWVQRLEDKVGAAFVTSLREELDAYGINNGELLLALDETTLPRQLPMLALPRWTAHAILLGRRLADIKALPGPHKMFESRHMALEWEGARRAELGAKEPSKRALSAEKIPELPSAADAGENSMKMTGSSESFHVASKPRRAAPTTARRTSCPDISKIIPEEPRPVLKRANTVQLTNTKPAAEVRPRAVISYSICQQDFMKFISGILKEWGFDPWSGADVLGGGNWAQQWIEMAEDKNTKLIVYILSRSFTLSPNCQTEFQFIMQDSKRAIVVPLMYEKFQLPKTFAFFLTTHNYVVVTPDIDTICQCPGKCQCDRDAREVQSQPPDTKWHFTFQRTIKFATGLTPWKRKEGASLTPSRSLNPHRSIQFKPFKETRRGNSDDVTGDSEPVARLVSNRPNSGAENTSLISKVQSMKSMKESDIDSDGDSLLTESEDEEDEDMEEEIKTRQQLLDLANAQKQKVLDVIAKDMHCDESNIRIIAVIGSTTFFNSASQSLCQEIGRCLAGLPDEYVLVTGGFKGVGATIARAFHDMRVVDNRPTGVYMVLPECESNITNFREKAPVREGTDQFREWEFGSTIFIGRSVKEREVLMGVMPVLVLVEGGPGAAHEATIASLAGKCVLPVKATGGAASGMQGGFVPHDFHNLLEDISPESKAAWTAINDPGLNVKDICSGLRTLVQLVHDNQDKVHHKGLAFRHGSRQLSVLIQGHGGGEPPENMKCLNGSAGSYSREHGAEGLQHLRGFMEKFAAVYLVNGHGSKNQYKYPETLQADLQMVITDLDLRHGRGNWLAGYGGDPYRPTSPDIAHILRIMHQEHGIPVIAVQCDLFEHAIMHPEKSETYAHLKDGAVFFYETKYRVDPSSGQRNVLYGGYQTVREDGAQSEVLVGGSSVWFHPEICKLLAGHIVIGGGRITRDDCRACQAFGVPIYYIKAPAKYCFEESEALMYGEIDMWMQNITGFWRHWAQRGDEADNTNQTTELTAASE